MTTEPGSIFKSGCKKILTDQNQNQNIPKNIVYYGIFVDRTIKTKEKKGLTLMMP